MFKENHHYIYLFLFVTGAAFIFMLMSLFFSPALYSKEKEEGIGARPEVVLPHAPQPSQQPQPHMPSVKSEVMHPPGAGQHINSPTILEHKNVSSPVEPKHDHMTVEQKNSHIIHEQPHPKDISALPKPSLEVKPKNEHHAGINKENHEGSEHSSRHEHHKRNEHHDRDKHDRDKFYSYPGFYSEYYPDESISIIPYEREVRDQDQVSEDLNEAQSDYDHRYDAALSTGEMYIDAREILSDEVLSDLQKIKGLDLTVIHADNSTFIRILVLSNLESLKISGNITRIPSGISKLNKLEWLDVSGNKIAALPYELGRLPKLEEIILNNNQLRELPASLAELKNLHGLYVAGNKLETISGEVTQMINLKNLDISGNPPGLYEQPAVRLWINKLIKYHAQVKI